ncbi:SAM-dependent methyltransferase [Ramlibacter albus]|uniref:SAM-dependent methyltransferase n=1 Tax=Ramlibacter albus TaxID=2079448 RepID=A0A923MDX7_9BURK|nr:SAM-dependent methyltransferase [Ramlibacter albus]MBC5768361.1 SAM-dependent methyltransferase [Ramlibacter albus]
MAGRLLLVPAPLDFGCEPPVPLDRALPDASLVAASQLTHWIVENAKTARAFLKRVGEVHPLAVPLQQMQMAELPREVHKKGDHAGGFDARPMLAAAKDGHDIGLLSEAGLPAVADPGSSVVRAAHDLGIEVVALAGTSSLLLALAASGLNGQNFAFVGYLPQDAAARTQRIRELEALALKGQTQLFIETPYRNQVLWQALLQSLRPSTRLAYASGLTLAAASNGSHAVQRWRELPAPVANDTPAVFAVGK